MLVLFGFARGGARRGSERSASGESGDTDGPILRRAMCGAKKERKQLGGRDGPRPAAVVSLGLSVADPAAISLQPRQN